jgi:hypothetical protein
MGPPAPGRINRIVNPLNAGSIPVMLPSLPILTTRSLDASKLQILLIRFSDEANPDAPKR